jgi:hypothetical protein
MNFVMRLVDFSYISGALLRTMKDKVKLIQAVMANAHMSSWVGGHILIQFFYNDGVKTPAITSCKQYGEISYIKIV